MTDLRPTLSAPDDDPYLWLEEVEGERAVAWVDAQTQRTRDRIADARWAADRDALTTLLDRPDNLPIPTRRGGCSITTGPMRRIRGGCGGGRRWSRS